MGKVSTDRVIKASPDDVWRALADFGGVHRFHPMVESANLLSEHNGGLDAMRVCNFYDGTSVKERVSGWKDGEHMRVELSEFSMPLKRATATLNVAPVGTDSARVTFALDYTPKFGPLGALMDVLMMKAMMGRMMKSVLKGLDEHVRTGALIGEKGLAMPVAQPA